MIPYVPPPRTCRHGRQTAHCAECAPEAEARWHAYVVQRTAEIAREVFPEWHPSYREIL